MRTIWRQRSGKSSTASRQRLLRLKLAKSVGIGHVLGGGATGPGDVTVLVRHGAGHRAVCTPPTSWTVVQRAMQEAPAASCSRAIALDEHPVDRLEDVTCFVFGPMPCAERDRKDQDACSVRPGRPMPTRSPARHARPLSSWSLRRRLYPIGWRSGPSRPSSGLLSEPTPIVEDWQTKTAGTVQGVS